MAVILRPLSMGFGGQLHGFIQIYSLILLVCCVEIYNRKYDFSRVKDHALGRFLQKVMNLPCLLSIGIIEAHWKSGGSWPLLGGQSGVTSAKVDEHPNNSNHSWHTWDTMKMWLSIHDGTPPHQNPKRCKIGGKWMQNTRGTGWEADSWPLLWWDHDAVTYCTLYTRPRIKMLLPLKWMVSQGKWSILWPLWFCTGLTYILYYLFF